MSRTRFSKSIPLLERPQDLVGGAEHAVEQGQLLGEQLEEPGVGGVLAVEEVEDQHVAGLAVAVAAADALLHPLRVPGKVVVHHQVAELEVQPLGAGLGHEQDLALVAELLHQRLALLGAAHAAREAGDLVALRLEQALNR